MYEIEESAFYKVVEAFIKESKNKEYANYSSSKEFAKRIIDDFDRFKKRDEKIIEYYKNLHIVDYPFEDFENFYDKLEKLIEEIKQIYSL